MTYLIVFTLLAALIAAIYYYRGIIQGQIDKIMQSRREEAAMVPGDLDRIIGSNPEPQLRGRYGRESESAAAGGQ